jgi:hypothetical protein
MGAREQLFEHTVSYGKGTSLTTAIQLLLDIS